MTRVTVVNARHTNAHQRAPTRTNAHQRAPMFDHRTTNDLNSRTMKGFKRTIFMSAIALSAIAMRPMMEHATLAAQEAGIAIGAAAPGAALQTLSGKPIDLKQFIGQKPVMLEFWATWCGNCKELQPKLIAATKKYGAQMTFVTIAVSVNQSMARVAQWHKLNPIATEMLYDLHGTASDAYDVPATSYVVMVNKAGKVVYTGVGGDQNLDAAIAKALKQ